MRSLKSLHSERCFVMNFTAVPPLLGLQIERFPDRLPLRAFVDLLRGGRKLIERENHPAQEIERAGFLPRRVEQLNRFRMPGGRRLEPEILEEDADPGDVDCEIASTDECLRQVSVIGGDFRLCHVSYCLYKREWPADCRFLGSIHRPRTRAKMGGLRSRLVLVPSLPDREDLAHRELRPELRPVEHLLDLRELVHVLGAVRSVRARM